MHSERKMASSHIGVESQVPGDGFEIWNLTGCADAGPDEFCSWLAGIGGSLPAVLANYGAIILRGTGVCQAADFQRAVEPVLPKLRDYVGGTSPRQHVVGKVMTATQLPPDWSVLLHQEMAYLQNPPAYICFFCQVPAAGGEGQTLLADMRKLGARLDKTVWQRCVSQGIRLRRTLPAARNAHLKPGIPKSWPEVLQVQTRAEADRVLKSKGWDFDWHGDETLVLWHEVVPACRVHPLTGTAVWCNQAHFYPPVCMMEWASEDNRTHDFDAIRLARSNHPELLDNMCYGDGTTIPDAEALHIYKAIKSLEFELELQRGDILLIDNLLSAHGRRARVADRQLFVLIADR